MENLPSEKNDAGVEVSLKLNSHLEELLIRNLRWCFLMVAHQ
jgi:hypothetical protein